MSVENIGVMSESDYDNCKPYLIAWRTGKVDAIVDSYTKAAATYGENHPFVKSIKAQMTIDGHGVEQDPIEGLRMLRALANSGYVPAIFFLGWRHLYGTGAAEDHERGFQLMATAYKAGFQRAALFLGRCYMKGMAVSVNMARALEYFEKALDAGEPGASGDIADLYYYEDYASKLGGTNFNVARKYYLKATSEPAGNGYAENILAYMYAQGLGVDADVSVAKDWYLKAFEKGYAEAACYLGYMYEKGQFGKADWNEAKKYYELGANAGEVTAATNLGRMYLNGWGVRIDLNNAKKYLKIAADKGHPPAVALLNDLKRHGALDELIERLNRERDVYAFRRSGVVIGTKDWTESRIHGNGYGVNTSNTEIHKVFIKQPSGDEACVEWYGKHFDTIPDNEVTVIYVGKPGTTEGWPTVAINYSSNHWGIKDSVANNWFFIGRGKITKIFEQLKDAAFKIS